MEPVGASNMYPYTDTMSIFEEEEFNRRFEEEKHSQQCAARTQRRTEMNDPTLQYQQEAMQKVLELIHQYKLEVHVFDHRTHVLHRSVGTSINGDVLQVDMTSTEETFKLDPPQEGV
jgi:hypothetical protein